MKTKYALIPTMVFLAGCSSVPKSGVDNAGNETVVARIGGMSSRPNWLHESDPFTISGGTVSSLGEAIIPVDDNVTAAYRIAENNAKSEVSHAIRQRLDFVFQNAEEGTQMGADQTRFIGAEASKLTTSAMELAQRYWEKVRVIGENGQASLQLRVYAMVQMPENDFRAAIIDAIRKENGKMGISAEFAKQVDQHWDKFVNGDQSTPREPAGGNSSSPAVVQPVAGAAATHSAASAPSSTDTDNQDQ